MGAKVCSTFAGRRPPLQWTFRFKGYFFFFFPPDFLLPEDLEADDFLESPPAFFAEEAFPFPPFLAFSAGGLPPPDGAAPPEEG